MADVHASLPIVTELQNISDNIQALVAKEMPEMPPHPMPPEVQKIEMLGAEVITIKGRKGDAGETPSDEHLTELIKPLIPVVRDGEDADEQKIIKEVLSKISKPKDGKDGKDGTNPPLETIVYEAVKQVKATLTPLIPKIEDIEKDLPKLGFQIRDSLELLPNGQNGTVDERIDKSAVKGIADIEKSIKDIQVRPVSVGGRSLLQLYVGGAKKGAIQYLNLIAGTNVTLTYAQSSGRNDVTISASGGGGGAPLVATGTINDTNVTFTFISEPQQLVINGLACRPTGGSITWSYVAGTVTLSSPIGTGGDIYGIS
jgi:hypothetical protein